ncbi:MAG: hypothetical protein QXJ18_01230 [Desulfurococcaceae archaeon]
MNPEPSAGRKALLIARATWSESTEPQRPWCPHTSTRELNELAAVAGIHLI